MERSLGLLLVLIATLATIRLVQAQCQPGFISLDCGSNELSPYNESLTGLCFSSDATFIQSGKTGRVQSNLESRLLKQYRTLRYFPDGKRNCYNVKVEKGRNHLIRARFIYGNYDGLDITPKFDMYIGPNLWLTIDLERRVNGTRREMLHIPTSNSLQICLVKTGETTPMISTLEIRPMGNDLYNTQSGSLDLYFRNYLSQSETDIRYPADAYDRQWRPYFQPKWTQISTNSDVDNSNAYETPKNALASAAIPTNANDPLTIEWFNSANDQYYFYHHFAEIQELQTNETREFSMVWNEEVISDSRHPIVPKRLELTTMSSTGPRTGDRGYCKFQLTRTNRSALPPLLNAWEVYTVIQFPQSETNENDGMFLVKACSRMDQQRASVERGRKLQAGRNVLNNGDVAKHYWSIGVSIIPDTGYCCIC